MVKKMRKKVATITSKIARDKLAEISREFPKVQYGPAATHDLVENGGKHTWEIFGNFNVVREERAAQSKQRSSQKSKEKKAHQKKKDKMIENLSSPNFTFEEQVEITKKAFGVTGLKLVEALSI